MRKFRQRFCCSITLLWKLWTRKTSTGDILTST